MQKVIFRCMFSGVAYTELFVRKSRKTLKKVCLDQREQILSFKSSPKCNEPNFFMLMPLYHKKFLTHVTHMRTCVLSATPMMLHSS